jgi:inositol phosphorylceramide mannosyltransferase catalytic subunit
MLIPRIFHQIWVGPDPFPEEFAAYQQSWLEHHPGWELRFWTEETFPPPEELRRPEAAERLRAPWERGDIFRLEILWRMGGVHVDTDFECRRPIEPLVEDTDFFIGERKPGRLNGALMGAVPGHQLLDLLLDEIRPRTSYGMQMGAGTANDKDETGPGFLDRMLLGRPEPTFVPPELFYPRTPAEEEQAYAIHHRARAWKDEEGLRKSLDKAEKRLREAQEEAQAWRRKYEQAQAQLEGRERPLGRLRSRLVGR